MEKILRLNNRFQSSLAGSADGWKLSELPSALFHENRNCVPLTRLYTSSAFEKDLSGSSLLTPLSAAGTLGLRAISGYEDHCWPNGVWVTNPPNAVHQLVFKIGPVYEVTKESSVYTRLLHLQGYSIPTWYGCYLLEGTHGGEHLAALVLGYTGHSLADILHSTTFDAFCVASADTLVELYFHLAILHHSGLWHGDAKARNLVVGRNASGSSATIIDFGESSIGHRCKGPACPELSDLGAELRLHEPEQDRLFRIAGPVAQSLKTNFCGSTEAQVHVSTHELESGALLTYSGSVAAQTRSCWHHPLARGSAPMAWALAEEQEGDEIK